MYTHGCLYLCICMYGYTYTGCTAGCRGTERARRLADTAPCII